MLVRLDRICARVLQFVCAQLVQQADAAAFLALVDEQTAARGSDFLERKLQLRAAVASKTVKYVTSQALRVDPDQRRHPCKIAHFQCDGVFRLLAGYALKAVDPESAESRGKVRFGDFPQTKVE